MSPVTPKVLENALYELQIAITQGIDRPNWLSRAETLLQNAKGLGDTPLIARAHKEHARALSHLGQSRAAITTLRDAVRLIEREKHPALLTWSLNELGELYYFAADYHAALDTWIKCLETASERGDMLYCAHAYMGIGKVYFAFDDFINALHFHRIAEQIVLPLGEDRLACAIQINLAADAYRLHDHGTALTALDAATGLMERGVQHSGWAAEVTSYYGLIHFEQREFESAERYLNDAYRIYRDAKNAWGESHVLLNLGRTYQKLGQPKAALECLQTANRVSDEANLPNFVLQTEELLSQLYLDVGEFKLALEHHKRLHAAVRERNRKQGGGLRLAKTTTQQLKQLDLRLHLERVRMRQATLLPR
ncbi:tetratricopeptide repeat protein [Andreprevotia chitinilytica]|uniref:tetratricopeptide repeat protein n=1 Tax=Andreprevotia chitinilytica TaxID=396808 RepID=UPI000552E526|nr:tetratricopeptide repeat protein [Andreprevotia chitinilytica]